MLECASLHRQCVFHVVYHSSSRPTQQLLRRAALTDAVCLTVLFLSASGLLASQPLLIPFCLQLPNAVRCSALAMSAVAAAATGSEADPQMYLEELALQDCSCTAPLILPQWRKWAMKSRSGKKKPHPQGRGGHAASDMHAHAHASRGAEMRRADGSRMSLARAECGWERLLQELPPSVP